VEAGSEVMRLMDSAPLRADAASTCTDMSQPALLQGCS